MFNISISFLVEGLVLFLKGPVSKKCLCSPLDELDELLVDNNKVILKSIAEDLRIRLPIDAMLPSETAAQQKVPPSCRLLN